MRAPNKQKRRGQEVGKGNTKCVQQGTGREEGQSMRTKSIRERKQHARVDTRSLSACPSKATTKGVKESRGRERRRRRGRGRGGRESKAERGGRGRSNNDGRAEKKNKQNTNAPRTQTPKSARRERYMTPRIGASGAGWSSARAPGLDRPGVNPVPRTGASEATGRIR